MKKLLLFLGITIFILGLATVALAGGYNPYEEGTKYTTKPHGDGSGSFFNNSTNFCKTCHAVHSAGEAGYKPGTLDPLGDAGDCFEQLPLKMPVITATWEPEPILIK